jgi:nucleoside-diphosphate-sugar epimerase
MTKPSLLITGHSGFVGSNLIRAFQNDFELFGLDISRECGLQDGQGKLPGEKVFGWDHLERLPEVEVIIHLAGKAHDTANATREQEYFDVNLGLTKKIFDHFLQSEAKTFIFSAR